MSSMRREKNGARSLEDWDTWIDRAIREAQRRGDFDNLPSAGKPLPSDDNPFAGDLNAAFSMLKNAGMAPPWIELDKEVRAAAFALAEFRERTARRLGDQLALARAGRASAEYDVPSGDRDQVRTVARGRWPFRLGRARERRAVDPDCPQLPELEAERQRARREYLDRAAQLDAKTGEYNALVPDALRSLQRPRITAERAAREFDTACPPISSDAWSSRGASASSSGAGKEPHD